jgi:hypothetical protein
MTDDAQGSTALPFLRRRRESTAVGVAVATGADETEVATVFDSKLGLSPLLLARNCGGTRHVSSVPASLLRLPDDVELLINFVLSGDLTGAAILDCTRHQTHASTFLT